MFWQLRRGQEWQKFIKVFREVKASLMQIGRRFSQLGTDKGAMP